MLSSKSSSLYQNLIQSLPGLAARGTACLENRYGETKYFKLLCPEKCHLGETYLRKASKNEHTLIPESLIFKKECF